MSTTYKKKAPVAKKVTKEELKQLQEFVAKLNNGAIYHNTIQIGINVIQHINTVIIENIATIIWVL